MKVVPKYQFDIFRTLISSTLEVHTYLLAYEKQTTDYKTKLLVYGLMDISRI